MFFIFCKEPDNIYFSLCENNLNLCGILFSLLKHRNHSRLAGCLGPAIIVCRNFEEYHHLQFLLKKKKSKFSATLHSCYKKKITSTKPIPLFFNHITDFIPPYTNFRTSRSESRSNKVRYKETCFFLEVRFQAYLQSLFQCHCKKCQFQTLHMNGKLKTCDGNLQHHRYLFQMVSNFYWSLLFN